MELFISFSIAVGIVAVLLATTMVLTFYCDVDPGDVIATFIVITLMTIGVYAVRNFYHERIPAEDSKQAVR